MSGRVWEEKRKRLYYLHRWPSKRAMSRIRQRVRELTPTGRCHADIRDVIEDLNSVLRGWGSYFRTGNAVRKSINVAGYVERRLRKPCVARKGRHLKPGEVRRWNREYFESFGLHRLRGTIRYPERSEYGGRA